MQGYRVQHVGSYSVLASERALTVLPDAIPLIDGAFFVSHDALIGEYRQCYNVACIFLDAREFRIGAKDIEVQPVSYDYYSFLACYNTQEARDFDKKWVDLLGQNIPRHCANYVLAIPSIDRIRGEEYTLDYFFQIPLTLAMKMEPTLFLTDTFNKEK